MPWYKFWKRSGPAGIPNEDYQQCENDDEAKSNVEQWASEVGGGFNSHYTYGYEHVELPPQVWLDGKIKAAADSLFHREGLVEKYSKLLPKYPDTIYHRWRLDRIIRMGGVKVDNIKELNYRLSEINGELGSKKQCNAIVVLIKNQPREYLYALEQYWVGANKNDIVLVISVDGENKIQWADVLAFVQKSIFKIELRDEIQKMPILEMDKVLTTLEDQIKKNYKRKRMRDFEYLTASITPSTTQYVVTIIICTILSVGLSIIFHREDVA